MLAPSAHLVCWHRFCPASFHPHYKATVHRHPALLSPSVHPIVILSTGEGGTDVSGRLRHAVDRKSHQTPEVSHLHIHPGAEDVQADVVVRHLDKWQEAEVEWDILLCEIMRHWQTSTEMTGYLPPLYCNTDVVVICMYEVNTETIFIVTNIKGIYPSDNRQT